MLTNKFPKPLEPKRYPSFDSTSLAITPECQSRDCTFRERVGRRDGTTRVNLEVTTHGRVNQENRLGAWWVQFNSAFAPKAPTQAFDFGQMTLTPRA